MFEEFPKMARLTRECVITEKIDGTNAQVFIRELPDDEVMPTDTPILAVVGNLLIYAGSRSRWLLPNPGRAVGGTVYTDNHGFAAWCYAHAEALAGLGPGRHFGEWWGSGIQRGYGLPKGEKRFSLFNTRRWVEAGSPLGLGLLPDDKQTVAPACCHVVPVLASGVFNSLMVEGALVSLEEDGSRCAPGFMDPEGVVIWHEAARQMFKKTIKSDAEPKGRVPLTRKAG